MTEAKKVSQGNPKERFSLLAKWYTRDPKWVNSRGCEQSQPCSNSNHNWLTWLLQGPQTVRPIHNQIEITIDSHDLYKVRRQFAQFTIKQKSQLTHSHDCYKVRRQFGQCTIKWTDANVINRFTRRTELTQFAIKTDSRYKTKIYEQNRASPFRDRNCLIRLWTFTKCGEFVKFTIKTYSKISICVFSGFQIL